MVEIDPIDGLLMAVIAVIAATYLPWAKFTTILPRKKNLYITDAHTAVHKLLDVIDIIRSHGDTDTAEKLGGLMPNIVRACSDDKRGSQPDAA